MGCWVKISQPQGEECWVNFDLVLRFDRAKKNGTFVLPAFNEQGRNYQESPEEVMRLIREAESAK